MRSPLIAAAALVFGACASAPPAPPQDPSALTVIAEVALERGDCKAASDAYASVSEASNDESLTKRALEIALGCEQLPAAARITDRWRELAPDNLDATKLDGVVALKLGRLDDARNAFAQALKRADDKAFVELMSLAVGEADTYMTLAAFRDIGDDDRWGAPPIILLGATAADAYDFKSALAYADRAIAKDAQSAQAQSLRARVLAAQNKPDAAIAAARRAGEISAEPGRFALTDVLIALDRSEEAHRELESLQREEALASEADRRLALLAFREGDDKDAERRFTERFRTNAGAGEALFYLGALAERRDDPVSALAFYEQLATIGGTLIATARAAAVLAEQGDRPRALRILDDYAAEHPEDAIDVTITKARLLIDGDVPDEAVGLIDAALAIYPDHPSLVYQRALALESASRIEEAVQAFEAQLRARPGDPSLMNALGYTLADHRRELPRAEQLIRRALQLTPDHPAVLDSLGWVQFRRGKTLEALPALERAYQISRDTEIAAHWGEVLWAAGREGEARAVWARALARDPASELLKSTVARFIPANS